MKLKRFNGGQKEFSDDLKEVTFKTRNPELLTKIVTTIGELGNPGHTFTIVLDPGSESETKFTWDGDGSDYIELDSTKSFDSLEREKREGHRQSYIIGWDITNNELIRRSVFGRPDKALETVISWLDNDDIKYRYLKSFTDSSEANDYAEELKSKMSKSFSDDIDHDYTYLLAYLLDNGKYHLERYNSLRFAEWSIDPDDVAPNFKYKVPIKKANELQKKLDELGADDFTSNHKKWNEFVKWVDKNGIKSFSEREQVPQYIADEVDASGVIVKYKGDWRIVSKKTTPYEFWDAKYKTKQDAEDALAAYHANK